MLPLVSCSVKWMPLSVHSRWRSAFLIEVRFLGNMLSSSVRRSRISAMRLLISMLVHLALGSSPSSRSHSLASAFVSALRGLSLGLRAAASALVFTKKGEAADIVVGAHRGAGQCHTASSHELPRVRF